MDEVIRPQIEHQAHDAIRFVPTPIEPTKEQTMNPFKQEPAVISAALVAVLNALVALHVFVLTVVQIGVVNIAVAAVLGLFVRQSVSPLND